MTSNDQMYTKFQIAVCKRKTIEVLCTHFTTSHCLKLTTYHPSKHNLKSQKYKRFYIVANWSVILFFLRLVPSPTSGKMENTPGVYTRNPGFGGTSGIEWLDPASHVAGVYFYPLIDTLHRLLGYTRGKDLRSAPYDFRYDPGSYNFYASYL